MKLIHRHKKHNPTSCTKPPAEAEAARFRDKDQIDVMEFLLGHCDEKLEVDSVDSEGRTLIHVAARDFCSCYRYRKSVGVGLIEFKAIGENHNQGRLGVEILVSGFVFEKEDFIRPWEGHNDNLERYIWESKNLISVSTAIQDWRTSNRAMMTVLSSLLTALAWPAALLSATDFIDSKWTIAIDSPSRSQGRGIQKESDEAKLRFVAAEVI
ncbi:hypothetical protein V8G54_035077 [Vigna mungo]|uniref:Uncharacterized protein n=1 Tax=Vigna mungo TaxID=3915 RepID=A0AAQ3RE09_VIGMU